MFVINPNPPKLPPELIERYSKIEPTTIGHVLNSGFVGVDIRGLWRRQYVVGRAITVRSVGMDSTAVHKVTEMLEPGDVVVVDMAGEREHSCWGGGLSRASMARGAIGAILDGPITDINEIEDLKFPVWGRGFTCLTTRIIGYGGEINVPVRIGNTVIQPGDLIVADDCGVIALSPETAWKWLPEFEAREARSAARGDVFATGVSLPEMSGANKLIEARMKEVAEKYARG
jgi:4-hydroxy-4-methyl-2-oxoglutarate aldolase